MYTSGTNNPVPRMVSPWTAGWGLVSEALTGSVPSSATYESANRGVYLPIHVPSVCVARRMWWANGSTVSASYNVEAGLYADAGYKPGVKLVTTGSVAQGTATTVQFADITDTVLTPGLWWLYVSCSSTSATFFRSIVTFGQYQELAGFNEASVGPGSSPATATPAERAAQPVYLFGFATTASP